MTNFKRPEAPQRKEAAIHETRERLERAGLPDPARVPAPAEEAEVAPDTVKQPGAAPVTATLPNRRDGIPGDERAEPDRRNSDADRPDVLPR